MLTLSEAPPAIDWNHYRSAFENPKVIDEYKKAYENAKYPKVEFQQHLDNIEAERTTMVFPFSFFLILELYFLTIHNDSLKVLKNLLLNHNKDLFKWKVNLNLLPKENLLMS